MKLQYQTHRAGCIQACLATLLEIPITSVPLFMDIPDDPNAGPDDDAAWYKAMQAYVRTMGFAFVEVHLAGRPWYSLPNEVLCIFTGTLPIGSKHAIVGKCSGARFIPVFDPLGGDRAPFDTVETVAFLVPVDPFYVVRMGRALEEIEGMSRAIPNRIAADAIQSAARVGLGKVDFQVSGILDAGGNKIRKMNGNG